MDSGDHAVGYWVNEKKDVLPTAGDLMGAWHGGDQWYPKEKIWIEKPSYKHLITAFNKLVPDPKVLGMSGFINKNNSADLLPWFQLDTRMVDLDWVEDGVYLIKALDDDNNVLYQTGFNLLVWR